MLRLYNSLSKRVEPFEAAGSPIRIYVCGVTPYDTTHVGHAFLYVVFDVLSRYLRFAGHNVRYVSNITDVDDSILERARQRGVDYRDLGDEQTRQFLRDMQALNMSPPDVRPRASEEIPKMIEIVSHLLSADVAYAVDGWVYFHAGAYSAYGQLGGYSRQEMIALSAERGGDPSDPRKHDALDFVLWQPSQPDEPRWHAPWGTGRPGWHLECSAMALRYLGETIDIHGGGADLVFPHHESEIAQSELHTGAHPFARLWMHVGMVRLHGEKMSKSLGNLVLARELLERHSAAAVRLHLLSFPYREGWDFVEADMAPYDELAAQVAELRRPAEHQLAAGDAFAAALDDNMDTPRAITLLRQCVDSARRGNAEAANRLSAYADIFGLS
ncbi:MAG TPA: cysteine--tRNA ligase [Chloroflexota bacterium]|nr:cysteine--tRNA ligase [Chloroflexota bacterium]